MRPLPRGWPGAPGKYLNDGERQKAGLGAKPSETSISFDRQRKSLTDP